MLSRLLIIILLQLAIVSSNCVISAENNNQKKSNTKIISKGTAISIAKRSLKGEVLSVKQSNSRGTTIYRVKMLVAKSRVKTVFVDGKTARVIQIN